MKVAGRNVKRRERAEGFVTLVFSFVDQMGVANRCDRVSLGLKF